MAERDLKVVSSFFKFLLQFSPFFKGGYRGIEKEGGRGGCRGNKKGGRSVGIENGDASRRKKMGLTDAINFRIISFYDDSTISSFC